MPFHTGIGPQEIRDWVGGILDEHGNENAAGPRSTASSIKDLSNKIGGARTPSSSGGRPAIFKRELKTTHATLGSKIIDTPVSFKFPDIFDGQAEFFRTMENTSDGSTLPEGTMPIGNTVASANYLLEFPVLDTPSFGSGELIGIELNVYHDNFSYNFETSLPDIEVYKLKRTLSTPGIFGKPRAGKVYTASSSWQNVPYIAEVFDGSGTALSGDLPTSVNTQTGRTTNKGLYLTLDDAWNINVDGPWNLRNRADKISLKTTFRNYYGTLWNGQWIILMVPKSEGSSHYWPNKIPSGRWHLGEFSVYRRYWDKEYAKWYAGENWNSSFQEDLFKFQNESKESAISIEDLDEAKINTDTTVFDSIRYTPAVKNTAATDEKKSFYFAVSTPYFSTLNSPSSGQALAMSTYIDNAGVASDTYTFGGTTIPYQSIMTMLRVPKPQRLCRYHTNSSSTDEMNMDALTVDIKFSILEMNKYHRSDIQDKTDEPTGHNLLRGFFVMFATRKPDSTENFADYIYNMNLTDDTKDNKTYGTNKKNNYNGVGFIRHTTARTNNTQEGKIMVTTTNRTTGGHSAYGWRVESGTPDRPYIEKGQGDSDDSVLDTSGDYWVHDVGTTEGTSFDTGSWYTLRAIIFQDGNTQDADGTERYGALVGHNTGAADGQILWLILDSDGKVIFKHIQDHVGNNLDGSIYDKTNRQHGFPSYLTLWLNNAEVGVEGEDVDGTGIYTDVRVDSTVKVVIDSINVYGVENRVSNNTVGERNNSRSGISITSETEMPLTAFKVAQTLGDTPVPFGTTIKAAIPTYISWGFNDNIFSNEDATGAKTNNFFLGDFSVSNPLFNDITDTTKSSLFVNTDGNGHAQHDTDIMFYLPEANVPLGMWHVEGRYVDMDLSPHINDHVKLSGINNVDHFTKKGFFTINNSVMTASGSGSGEFDVRKYHKRENPAVATKITDVSNAKKGIIEVKNPEVLKGYYDDEFIIYRAGYAADFSDTTSVNEYYLKGLTIKDGGITENSISLIGPAGINIRLAQDESTPLCHDNQLHELYISPYKYWVMCEIYNVEEDDRKTLLPPKTYGHSVIQKDIIPADVTRGMTLNEFTYSDTAGHSRKWNLMNVTDGGIIEDTVDYGFGATNSSNEGAFVSFDGESGVGYIQKYVPELGYNAVRLDGLVHVEGDRLIRPNEKISLFIKAADDVSGVSAFHTTNSDQKPYLVFYYADAQPAIGSFSVKPSEADPFYPTYTWDVSGDDLWYGFLMLSASNSSTVKVGGSAIVGTSEIKHQYEGAVAHIPLNEPSFTDKDDIFLYRYDGTNGGVAVDATGIGDVNQGTIEGLAGNAFYCKGSGDQYVEFASTGFTSPTNQFSLVAHFTCESLHASNNRYIISQNGVFELYVDTSGNINATLAPDTGTTVTLKSVTLVNTDGQTPMNVILTLDYSLATGNVKLFINGKLEDQSGVKTTAGSVNNWKIGQRMNTNTNKVMIGATIAGVNAANHHHGSIEEVVLYNQAIYPVIPQTGEMTIYKAVPELTMGDPQAGISNTARLFVKDYHNIRGTLANEVAASSAVSYRKSGLGLKSIV